MRTEFFGIFAIAGIIYIMIYALLLAYSIASYVLNSLGMYIISKRRRVSNPAFAWIPIADTWLLGAIADHYDETVNGKKKKSRIILLSLTIAMLIVLAVLIVSVIALTFLLANGGYNEIGIIILVIVLMAAYVAFLGIAITSMVFSYIAYYKLFMSCRPDKAVLYLVLSIVISFSLPVIIFIIRNDDKGMITDETVAV